MRYKSCAKWPEGTCDFSNNVTRVVEPDKVAAEIVCKKLERSGFGGEGKVFPLKTWIEEESY